MEKLGRGVVAAVVLAVLVVAVSGCQKNEGPMERSGKAIDNTADKTGHQINKAVEKTGDALEKAGDKVKDSVK